MAPRNTYKHAFQAAPLRCGFLFAFHLPVIRQRFRAAGGSIDCASRPGMKAARVFILCCLVSSGFAAQRPQSSQPQNSTAAPDVYLVTIDTLRADHIHCYGYESIQTPALDALAKDGIRFAHAFTPSPITNTSHISILTGLLPSTHGVTDFAVPLAPTYSTLAELLPTNSQPEQITPHGIAINRPPVMPNDPWCPCPKLQS